MKVLITLLTISLLITSCSSSAPTQSQIVDNGKPGRIVVNTFIDKNANGEKDEGEVGLIQLVGIVQDVLCSSADFSNLVRAETNRDGDAVFNDLKPGRYCVIYMGGQSTTTRINFDILLSSEQSVEVFFGLLE